MKKGNFRMNILEEGRICNGDLLSLKGGTGGCNFACPGKFAAECMLYTECGGSVGEYKFCFNDKMGCFETCTTALFREKWEDIALT